MEPTHVRSSANLLHCSVPNGWIRHRFPAHRASGRGRQPLVASLADEVPVVALVNVPAAPVAIVGHVLAYRALKDALKPVGIARHDQIGIVVQLS